MIPGSLKRRSLRPSTRRNPESDVTAVSGRFGDPRATSYRDSCFPCRAALSGVPGRRVVGGLGEPATTLSAGAWDVTAPPRGRSIDGAGPTHLSRAGGVRARGRPEWRPIMDEWPAARGNSWGWRLVVPKHLAWIRLLPRSDCGCAAPGDAWCARGTWPWAMRPCGTARCGRLRASAALSTRWPSLRERLVRARYASTSVATSGARIMLARSLVASVCCLRGWSTSRRQRRPRGRVLTERSGARLAWPSIWREDLVEGMGSAIDKNREPGRWARPRLVHEAAAGSEPGHRERIP